jgi:hypothetical protein
MTLRQRSHDYHVDLSNNTHDVIEIPRWHWCNRGNPYTTYFYTTLGYHGSIAGLHGSIFFSFLRNISRWWWCTLLDKLCMEGNISVRILKWFWWDIFVQISQIRSLYIGNHWSQAWDKKTSVHDPPGSGVFSPPILDRQNPAVGSNC